MKNCVLEKLEQRMKDYGSLICHATLNDPIPQEWESYVTQSPVALEVIQDVLYDTLTYTSASTSELIFLQQTLSSVKRDITNMVLSGMLPNPESFLIQCPRFYVKWAATALTASTFAATVAPDLVLLTNTGIVTMQFGTKRYGPYPLWIFTAGGGPDMRGFSMNATAPIFTDYAQLGGPNSPLFAMFPHMMLAPLQSFNCTANWPSGAVTLGAGNPPLEWLFEGQRARAIS
jgi:hypothetical protein